MFCWLWPTTLLPFVRCVQHLAQAGPWYSLVNPAAEKVKEEPLVLAKGKATESLGQVFYSSGVVFCAVPFRTEPKSHRQVGESSSKLFPVTATYQGISNSCFYSCICWIKSILFKITALTFEPFRQTASGSTLFFCWKGRKKNHWHVINRTRQNLKSEWHSLLNNELQILCSKLLYHSNGMGGFREDSNLFCLSPDLVCRQMLVRIVPLTTYLYRAYKILDQNGKPEQVGVRPQTHCVKSELTLKNPTFPFNCPVLSPERPRLPRHRQSHAGQAVCVEGAYGAARCASCRLLLRGLTLSDG